MTGNMPNILDKKTTGPADLWTLDKEKIHHQIKVKGYAGVNFINIKRMRFSYERHFGSFF